MTRPVHLYAGVRPTAWHRIKALWLHVTDRQPEAVGVALALLFCAAIFGLAEVVHHAGMNPFAQSMEGAVS